MRSASAWSVRPRVSRSERSSAPSRAAADALGSSGLGGRPGDLLPSWRRYYARIVIRKTDWKILRGWRRRRLAFGSPLHAPCCRVAGRRASAVADRQQPGDRPCSFSPRARSSALPGEQAVRGACPYGRSAGKRQARRGRYRARGSASNLTLCPSDSNRQSSLAFIWRRPWMLCLLMSLDVGQW
jgi:hypothetical protein